MQLDQRPSLKRQEGVGDREGHRRAVRCDAADHSIVNGKAWIDRADGFPALPLGSAAASVAIFLVWWSAAWRWRPISRLRLTWEL